MSLYDRWLVDWPGRLLAPLESPLLLVMRLWVSWQFLKSGYLKVTDWDTTLFLFTDEYRVPLLPPAAAAVAGTAGELVFPALLMAGVAGRLSAAGLWLVNATAVAAYAHVLLKPGFEAAVGQHVLWAVMLTVLLVFGPGRWSVDRWLTGRARP